MPETNFSLIDLKALSKPACKLIESVRSTVGILYEPTRIRRKARADADATIIMAKNQLEIKDIEVRANERVINNEIRRQENIESITRNALKELPETVSTTPVDEDWIYQFFNHCQDIRNDDIQSLWSKILAGEVAQPNTYSLRTLNLLKTLSKEDAALFTKLCSFAWLAPDESDYNLLFRERDDSFLKESGLVYDKIIHLQSIGLIHYETTGISLGFDEIATKLDYFKKRHIISFPKEEKKMRVGDIFLTDIGNELVPISGAIPNEKYRTQLIESWKKSNIEVKEFFNLESIPNQPFNPTANSSLHSLTAVG